MRNKSDMHGKLRVFRMLIIIALLVAVSVGMMLALLKMDDVVYADGELGGLNDYEFKSMVDGKIIEILKDDGQQI